MLCVSHFITSSEEGEGFRMVVSFEDESLKGAYCQRMFKKDVETTSRFFLIRSFNKRDIFGFQA